MGRGNPPFFGGTVEYPRFVYISPGANKCEGGTFDCELVREEREHKAAVSAGFSDSVPEALESSDKIRADDADTIAPKRGRPAKVKE